MLYIREGIHHNFPIKATQIIFQLVHCRDIFLGFFVNLSALRERDKEREREKEKERKRERERERERKREKERKRKREKKEKGRERWAER